MDIKNFFIILFFTGTLLNLCIEAFLEHYDYIWRKKHGTDIPEGLKDYISAETLKKTCSYENAKYKNWFAGSVLSFLVSVYLVYMCFYPAVYSVVKSFSGTGFFTAVFYLILIEIPQLLISIPFAYYREFNIEKSFGFSKTSLKLWINDQIKGVVLSIILMMPLVFAFTLVLKYIPGIWWLFLGVVYIGFSLLISVLYPRVIAPLFNKFTPVEDEQLKTRLEEMMKKEGLTASSIKVMDASRRSGHSNAYFTGMGKSKGIVLYDTLLKQLTVDEIVAVVGHEVGHCKKHHITKRMCMMIPLVFAVLFAASLIINSPYLYAGFGFVNIDTGEASLRIAGAMLLMEVFGGFTIILDPVFNGLSRKDEFQADEYGVKLSGSPVYLKSALIKLNSENLSELTVPKLYSIFKYNHPPLIERIAHIE